MPTRRTTSDLSTSFVAATPAVAAKLRREPEGIHALLEGQRDETGLDRWAHAVQFLLTGKAKGVRGPLAWLTTGGERLGRTARWLTPEQVAALSALLDEVEPDDLGDGTWNEAALDAAQVAPGGWVRAAETTDRLSTIRELYAYLREQVALLRKARKGLLVVTRREERLDDDEDDVPAAPPPEPAPPPPPGPPGELVLEGTGGRRYERGLSRPAKTLDPALARVGLRPLGDLVILPALADRVVRAYRSDDGTIVAALVLDGEKVSSSTFLSVLERDAVVLTSDAFALEKPRKRFFARTLSGASPSDLVAALRERSDELTKKHGAPVAFPAELLSAARAWEAWWARAR